MKSPFKFLDSFTKEDREIFFGREKEIEELYQRVFRSKIMLVYGVSGTGKSSLINCGLANKFQDEDWLPLNIRRGKNMLESMYAAIVAASLTPKSQYAASEIQFRKYVKSLYLDHYKPIYFIFDQFEELFIFGSKEEKSLFVRVIKTLVDSGIQCRFIFVMREEYMANVTEFERHIPVFFSNRVRIENMDINNAIQAIKGPCKVSDISIEEGFPEALIENLSPGSPDIELTYLQVFLDKVYRLSVEEMETGKGDNKNVSFTLDQLRKVGNVSDLLGTFLNEQISLLDDPDTALAVLKSFVSVKGTKRQMNLDEVKEYSRTLGKPISDSALLEMLQNFVNLRILRDKDQHDRYELRHDSLATKIYEKISGVEKDILEIRQFIEDGWHNWQKRGILLSASDLEYIAPYESRLYLSSDLLSLITQSKNQLEKVKTKRRVIFVVATFVLLIAFACFTVWALIERNTSKKQEIIANANYYNALSKELVSSDPTKALRIAEYACKLNPSQNNYQNLVNIYSDHEFYFPFLPARQFNVTDFKVFSKSGNIAIVENGKIRILNPNGDIIRETNFTLPRNFAFDISPDGKYLLIYNANDTLKVYDEKFNLKSKIFLNNYSIEDAHFSEDNKVIISAPGRLMAGRGKILLWSMDGLLKETKESFTYGFVLNNLSSDTINFLIQPKDLYCWIPDKDKLIKRNLKFSGSEYIYDGKFISKNQIAFLTNNDTLRICNLDGVVQMSWYAGDEENRDFGQLLFLDELKLLCTFNNKIIKFWDLNGQNTTNLKLRSSTSISFQFNHLTGDLLFLLGNQINYYKPVNLNNELILKKDNKNIQYYTYYGNSNCFIEYSKSDKHKNVITVKGDKIEKTNMYLNDDKHYYKIPGGTRVFAQFPEKYNYKADNQVKIYDIFNGKLVVQLKDLNEFPVSIINSKDGSLFAAVGKRTYMDSTNRWYYKTSLRFYNREGTLLKDFSGSKIVLPYADIQLTSDNIYFLSANYRTATLQDTSGKVISRFNLQTSYINSTDISSDGNYILTAAEDKTARLWSRDGKLLKVIQTNESYFQTAFIPGELAFQIIEPNSCKLYNIDGIMMQKIQTSDRLIYSPEGRFLFYIANDGIHRTKLKQPVDSFILSNNHNDIAFNEKMEYNILSLKDLLKSGKPGDVYQAGTYFLDVTGKKTDVKEKEYSIKTAEKLFKKGLTFDTLHGAIARRLTELYILKNQFVKVDIKKEVDNCYKIMTESSKRDDLINAFVFYATVTFTGELDSLHISYGYVDKVISLSQKLLNMFPEDQSIKQRICARCSDLSFSLLDFKQYENALVAIKLAIKADSTYPYSYTNLPLAYLFNNKFDEASREYKKWMDKPWTASPDAKTYREVFILDIKDLESRGITHPDYAKVKELLK